MPKSFPRAPLPFVAALVSPLAWLYGRPDLFDTYSAGVLLLQMSGEWSTHVASACLPAHSPFFSCVKACQQAIRGQAAVCHSRVTCLANHHRRHGNDLAEILTQ